MSEYDIIIAFPGCGKSTLSKTGKAIDVDFGTWRDARGVSRYTSDPDEWEAAMLDFYVDELLPKKGQRPLLTNEAGLLDILEKSDVCWHTAVVVPHPSFVGVWRKNLVRRTAHHKPQSLLAEDSFCLEAMEHADQWIRNWIRDAKKHECDIIYMSDYYDLELLVDGKNVDELVLYSQLTEEAINLSGSVFAAVLGNAGHLYHEPWMELSRKMETTRHEIFCRDAKIRTVYGRYNQ